MLFEAHVEGCCTIKNNKVFLLRMQTCHNKYSIYCLLKYIQYIFFSTVPTRHMYSFNWGLRVTCQVSCCVAQYAILVCWLYIWYSDNDHISGMLTKFLVCWPNFWYVDHISGMLTKFLVLVCWLYFWYNDNIFGMLTILLVLSQYFW